MPKRKRGANASVRLTDSNTTEVSTQMAPQEETAMEDDTVSGNTGAMNDFLEAESIRVQKAEWVRMQLEEQHQNDAKAWERLVEEQKALSERNLSIEEDMNRNRHLQRYQQECVEDLKAQVYALHGISEDKLEGMKEYKNARYQGIAVAVFVLSIMLAAVSGYFIGVLSEVTLFMLGCLGVEGALLSQEGRRGRFLDGVCRFLYMLPLPAMLSVFVCYVMDLPYYETIIYWGAIAAVVVLVIGTVSYFLHNPYRNEKKRIRAAKADLKEVEQSAKKAVRVNQKLRLKEEKKSAANAQKQARKQARSQKRQEASAHRKENWDSFRQNTAEKWNHFVTGIRQKSEARKIEKARIKAENANAQMQQLQAQATAVPAAIVPAEVQATMVENGTVMAQETPEVAAETGMVMASEAPEPATEITVETEAIMEPEEAVTATIISINGEKRKQQA